jgi:hypothetical protein
MTLMQLKYSKEVILISIGSPNPVWGYRRPGWVRLPHLPATPLLSAPCEDSREPRKIFPLPRQCALKVLAVHAISTAQALNADPHQVDAARL